MVVEAEPPGGQAARAARGRRRPAGTYRSCRTPGSRSIRRRKSPRTSVQNNGRTLASARPAPHRSVPGAAHTRTGSEAMMSLPPAQEPSSATGCASARTSRSASAAVSSQPRARLTRRPGGSAPTSRPFPAGPQRHPRPRPRRPPARPGPRHHPQAMASHSRAGYGEAIVTGPTNRALCPVSGREYRRAPARVTARRSLPAQRTGPRAR